MNFISKISIFLSLLIFMPTASSAQLKNTTPQKSARERYYASRDYELKKRGGVPKNGHSQLTAAQDSFLRDFHKRSEERKKWFAENQKKGGVTASTSHSATTKKFIPAKPTRTNEPQKTNIDLNAGKPVEEMTFPGRKK